jgi:serpin B
MWLNRHLQYARVAGAELLQLPYVSGLAMLIVLPAAGMALDSIEARLPGEYERWLRALADRRVHVELPPWTVESRMSFEGPLRAQGIAAAFDPGAADFSGISAQGIYLQSAIHDAFIAVDERGTEAASLTEIRGGLMADEVEEPRFFRADRPFVYFLRDPATGAIAFAGILTNPKS